MVSPETGFRTRATTLLHSTSPFRTLTHGSDLETGDSRSRSATLPANIASITEKKDGSPGRDSSVTPSSNEKTLTPGGEYDYKSAPRHVRTIPTWVRSLEEEDEDEDAASQLLPKAPPGLQIAQHNNSPAFKGKHKHEPVRGRLHDADREWAPPTPRSHVTEIGSRWRSFADASAYPPISSDTGQQVTEEWLIQNGTDYSQPWRVALLRDEQDARTGGFSTSTKRKVWWKKSQRIVLRSPIIPLVVRTIVWVFSLIALVLGCSIYRHVKSEDTVLANEETSLNQGTSPLMAIIVDAFALVYLVYITYDEYTGKPLGLRSAKAKLRLIFLDLFFIIFDSANLSLAFEALSIHSQAESPGLGKLPSQQEALASVLLIALIAWMMTFSVSVLRLVEKVVQR